MSNEKFGHPTVEKRITLSGVDSESLKLSVYLFWSNMQEAMLTAARSRMQGPVPPSPRDQGCLACSAKHTCNPPW